MNRWHDRWHDPATRLAYRRFRRRPQRLQRKLFIAFGFAIFATMASSAMLFAAIHGAVEHRPWMRLFVLFAAACVLWTIAGLFARRIAWPLWELARAVKEFGSGKLERRVTVTRRAPSEVAELATAFNDMAARIESQMRQQRELLGAVSHELRTPLARQRVLLAMLQESGDQPALAAKFEREVVEMDALVGELLAEARISAGALNRRSLDLYDVVHECVERLGLERVAIEIADTSRALDADPTLLSRALTILLDNARKHGGDGIRVHAEARAGELRIAVEDDGPGIDPDDFTRLFEPFARGRGAAADERLGVGLGLYLVRRIAEAHGGQVFADNRAEAGASVGLVLPRTRP